MTITQLEYVIAVDNHRNFAEAARRCFITQPTLSMQIKKLEEELEILIFDRSKKPVIPTEIGSRIIAQARDGLASLEGIRELVRQQREDLSGSLRVGILPTLSPYLLPQFAGSFAQRYPEVDLQVEEMQAGPMVELLSSDLLDAGILAGPLGAPGIREVELFSESIYVYLSEGHPLLDQQRLVAHQLPERGRWRLRPQHCFERQCRNLLDRDELQANLRFEADHLETLKRMVDSGTGYTLLPELALSTLSAEERARLRPISDPLPLRAVHMVTHRSYLKQQLIEVLRNEIETRLPAVVRSPKEGRVLAWKE